MLFGGLFEISESVSLGILEIILGIIALDSWNRLYASTRLLFAFLAGFIIYIVGIFFVIAGIIGVITKAGNSRWNGVSTNYHWFIVHNRRYTQ